MTKLDHHYVYECAPSTELRGRRADHDKGCGNYNVRGTNVNLNDTRIGKGVIQSRPCQHRLPDGTTCGKRQRLSAENVITPPYEVAYDSRGIPDREARKLWAYQTAEENNTRLSISRRNAHQTPSTTVNEVSTISPEVSTNREEVSTND